MVKLWSIEIWLIWLRLMSKGLFMGKGLRGVNEGLKGVLILLI
jgi:hypothetical protein